MTDTTQSVTWLTQEAYDRLKAEHDQLAGTGRTDIAKKIEADQTAEVSQMKDLLKS